MNIDNISSMLEKICPLSLAPFEFNGLLTDFNSLCAVKRLGFTLGFSKTSIDKATARKIDMLIVHDAPESLFKLGDDYYKKVIERINSSNLSIYRMHLPLDFVKGGIIDQLCRMMRLNARPVDLEYKNYVISGGIYMSREELLIKDVMNRVQLINPSSIRIVKSRKRKISSIAVASGDGCKPEFLLQLRPDVLICGLLNQESIRIASDLDIALIELTSYATENEPLKKFVAERANCFSGIKVDFIDVKNDIKSYTVNK
jgi:putative NIF3 family GTP cyclohydrolase 1 type 2